MAEGAQIDYGGHKNDLEYVVREMLDFDKLVGQAMEFVDQRSTSSNRFISRHLYKYFINDINYS